MTDADDHDPVDEVTTWSRELRAIDVPDADATRIQQRARLQVGRGPSPMRLVLPVIAGLGTAGYLAWALYKIIDIFR